MVFVQNFKSDLFHTDSGNFKDKCLAAFHFQYENNTLYQKYVDEIGVKPNQVKEVIDIPFLPISFFKRHKIIATKADYISCFESSGTTGTERSKLFFYDEEFYNKNAKCIFEQFFGDLSDYSFFFLLPNYLERKNSSLVSMANYFANSSDNRFGGFYLHDFQKLTTDLITALLAKKGKVILWGVTFALLDYAEKFANSYPELIVFETGGMKGRGREPLRTEVHQELKSKLGVQSIHSEYGMTELFSQGYTLKDDIFTFPPQMKVLIRELEDPLFVHQQIGVRGGINVIDLANIDTCCFIETQDIGMLNQEGFQVLGRFDNSEIRGCNLMVVNGL